MDETLLRSEMVRYGVWADDGHYAYSSGRHGNTHYDKHGVSVHPYLLKLLSATFAAHIDDGEVDAVLSPAYSGIPLVHWTAAFLTEKAKREILAIYAVKAPEKTPHRFMFIGGMDMFIKDKKIVILEDNINTGESIRELTKLITTHGGKVTKVVTILNKGGVQLEEVEQVTLFSQNIHAWRTKDCPLCPAPITPLPKRLL